MYVIFSEKNNPFYLLSAYVLISDSFKNTIFSFETQSSRKRLFNFTLVCLFRKKRTFTFLFLFENKSNVQLNLLNLHPSCFL